MLNQAILTGRLVNEPISEREGEKVKTIITIATQRNYKNEDGIYDTDFIDVVLYNSIATKTIEYCKKGDLIGVNCRIETSNYIVNDEKRKQTYIVANKVTLLSSKRDK